MPLTHTSEPDPIADMPWEIRKGLNIERKADLRLLIYRHDQGFCGEQSPNNVGYVCTRPAGHPEHWKHVAADGWEILSVWGGGKPPNDGELVDPEDGSPVDPETALTKADLEIGGIYKLRDRVNKLEVIGGVEGSLLRKDGQIEVIDFTKHEQRAVPVEEIVKVEGLALSFDEFSWSIQFAQELRMKIKEEAVSNYHKNLWCENGLQDGLRDLGLPKYVPQQRGEVVVKIPYVATTGAKTSAVKQAVSDLLDIDAIKKALKGLDPDNDDELEVRPEAITFGIQEVTRK